MNFKYLPLFGVLLAFVVAPAMAQGDRGRDGRDGRGGGDDRRAEFMKRFDKDGDGQISDSEREEGFKTFREEREKRREEFMKKFDKDGDGQLSEEERNAVRDSFRADEQKRRDLHEYDKNEDGILSDSEKAAMEEDKAKKADDRKAEREALIKKYDTNGNGKIDGAEVEAVKKDVAEAMAQIRSISELARELRDSGDKSLDGVVGSLRRWWSWRSWWPRRAGCFWRSRSRWSA